MFDKLLEIWKGDSLYEKALKETATMLKKSEALYGAVAALFLRGAPLDFNVFEGDKEINRLEMTIRRKVLEHLSINPRQDLVASLVLTSIVIDIERIGDYSKNVYELHEILQSTPKEPEYLDRMEKLNTEVLDVFKKALQAFCEENEKAANAAMEAHKRLNADCEKMIRDLAEDETLRPRQVITYGLYSRYVKRVSAHLANIVSSVINPFDRIGYFLGNDL